MNLYFKGTIKKLNKITELLLFIIILCNKINRLTESTVQDFHNPKKG
jgi:hypothetical protein